MQESGYFIDGGKGGEIFTFLSRRFLFFSKPDFCAVFTQLTSKRPKLNPLTPIMVV